MKFVMVDTQWHVSLKGETLSFEDFVAKIKEFCHFVLVDPVLEQHFLLSKSWNTTEKDKSGKFVPSPRYSQSWFDIWFDYVQARIYAIETEKFKVENGYSLKDGKHVKLIDKHGDAVLKQLKELIA